MRQPASGFTVEDMNKDFEQLRSQLRPKILEEIMHQGLRDSMIKEYSQLAESTYNLIELLRTSGVAETLLQKSTEKYEQLMGELAVSGQRFKLLVDESTAVDETALLALADDGRQTIN